MASKHHQFIRFYRTTISFTIDFTPQHQVNDTFLMVLEVQLVMVPAKSGRTMPYLPTKTQSDKEHHQPGASCLGVLAGLPSPALRDLYWINKCPGIHPFGTAQFVPALVTRPSFQTLTLEEITSRFLKSRFVTSTASRHREQNPASSSGCLGRPQRKHHETGELRRS